MTLREKIEADLFSARKNNEKELIEILRVIVGEFQRYKSKEIPESEVISKLKKFRENELETLKIKNETTSMFLEVVNSYLPQMVT